MDIYVQKGQKYLDLYIHHDTISVDWMDVYPYDSRQSVFDSWCSNGTSWNYHSDLEIHHRFTVRCCMVIS